MRSKRIFSCILVFFLFFIISISSVYSNIKQKPIYHSNECYCNENDKDFIDLNKYLSSKNFSILGDSISTFSGYSNDNKNTNSTIGSNAVYYNPEKRDFKDVNDTWWMRVVNETSMNLLVNNSWSGDKVITKATKRASELHDDTGNNKGTNPDIIAIYLGTNDYNYKVDLNKFYEEYEKMVKIIIDTYDNPDIFLINILPNGKTPVAEIYLYNDVIRSIAYKYNCTLVDIFNNSSMDLSNMSEYTLDPLMIHPNEKGMERIKDVFVDALIDKYIKKK